MAKGNPNLAFLRSLIDDYGRHKAREVVEQCLTERQRDMPCGRCDGCLGWESFMAQAQSGALGGGRELLKKQRASQRARRKHWAKRHETPAVGLHPHPDGPTQTEQASTYGVGGVGRVLLNPTTTPDEGDQETNP